MSAVIAVLAAGLLLAAVALFGGRFAPAEEKHVWRLMLLGTATVSAALAAASVLDLLAPAGHPRPTEAGELVFSLGCALAAAPIYQGLIHWNRLRTRTSDPGETVNGISAVLVLVALGNLIVPHMHAAGDLSQWQLQATLVGCSGGLLLLGTAGSVIPIGGLQRDPRIWLVVTGLTAASGLQTLELFTGMHGQTATRLVWVAAMALITVCPLLPPGPGRPRAQSNQAAISGALVVLLCGVISLTIDNRLEIHGNLLATGYALAGVLGATLRIFALVKDLATLAQTRHEAMTDELTGIPNRRALLAAIEQALSSEQRVALLLLDLDRFKEVNDRYGHAAGDRLLRHVSDSFAGLLPETGLLARLGGDEFAVLLTGPQPGDALTLALAMAGAIGPLEEVQGRVLQVGASVGVALDDLAGMSGGELLRRADAAMYQAKTAGSGVRVYDSALDAAGQERLELIEDLQLALTGPAGLEQLVVYFQPQLSTVTGRVTGAEALVRWDHPRLGLLAPDTFIHLAEQNGLMPALTARVLREATVHALGWAAAGRPLRVSVNLSASSLADPALLDLIHEVLSSGLPAHELVLEVTETSLMTDPERSLRAMKRIAARGVGVSIDDYGTGYSSLSYLNDLPATELKIDRSFTSRIVTDPRTAAIVAGTVDLAHRLGLRLVAEGVEDEATLEVIARLGCDETQGYLHSRPLPPEIFVQWLRARDASDTSDVSDASDAAAQRATAPRSQALS